MATQDELLQRIAAAAIPHKLGRLYSRYGQPAPRLGEDRTAPVLGREAVVGGRGVNALGQAGRSESQQISDEERAALSRDEALDARADEAAGGAVGQEPDVAGDQDYQESLKNLQKYAQTVGVGSGELEDMKRRAPDLTEDEARQYLTDKARGSHLTWEDWLDERDAELTEQTQDHMTEQEQE